MGLRAACLECEAILTDLYSTLKFEVSGRVATVTLNRPDVRNAFGAQTIRELTVLFASLNGRRDISVVVLKGEGKSFCAGADLAYMQSMANFSLSENEQEARNLHEMFWMVRACPHPVVGKVQGHAMGGGLGLTALCDIVGAVDGTQFCFSEVKLGLAPAVISPFVLERMQISHARRYMISGEVFDAAAAKEAGLVHFAGSEAEVDAFVERTVAAITQNGPDAVRATKGLLRAVLEISSWPAKTELTTQVIAERRVSEEGQEGMRSFLEKRAPKWRST
jgi:methylglutaconyl-CoA hydratase